MSPTQPAITTSLRGLAHIELTVKAASRDLHSGLYGGPAMNPIRALTRILGALFDAEGRVQIPGFYDGIVEPSEAQLRQWRSLGFDEARVLGPVGLSRAAGEADRSFLEQLWARPTLEINGIIGGYTGPGTKTVIPAEASAKITFRLVPGQRPDAILEGFKSFVTAHLPADSRAEFTNFGGSPAIGFDTTLPAIRGAADALAEEWGAETILMGCGSVDPYRRGIQAQARHGFGARRLRARRRPHPFAEREIQSDEFQERRPVLGAHSGSARRLEQRWILAG